MSKFTRINFVLSLVMFVAVVAISFLGAVDYFADKATPSGFAWLLLAGSSATVILGFCSLIVDYAKAAAPEWNDNNG